MCRGRRRGDSRGQKVKTEEIGKLLEVEDSRGRCAESAGDPEREEQCNEAVFVCGVCVRVSTEGIQFC